MVPTSNLILWLTSNCQPAASKLQPFTVIYQLLALLVVWQPFSICKECEGETKKLYARNVFQLVSRHVPDHVPDQFLQHVKGLCFYHIDGTQYSSAFWMPKKGVTGQELLNLCVTCNKSLWTENKVDYLRRQDPSNNSLNSLSNVSGFNFQVQYIK